MLDAAVGVFNEAGLKVSTLVSHAGVQHAPIIS